MNVNEGRIAHPTRRGKGTMLVSVSSSMDPLAPMALETSKQTGDFSPPLSDRSPSCSFPFDRRWRYKEFFGWKKML